MLKSSHAAALLSTWARRCYMRFADAGSIQHYGTGAGGQEWGGRLCPLVVLSHHTLLGGRRPGVDAIRGQGEDRQLAVVSAMPSPLQASCKARAVRRRSVHALRVEGRRDMSPL